jgi:serine/threonine protein kinase
MDLDGLYRFAIPLLGVTMIDVADIEVKLFNLVYDINKQERKKYAKIAEVVIYLGEIQNAAHFERIMSFIDCWNEMIANFILSRGRLNHNDHGHDCILSPSTYVCLVENPSMKDIPLSSHFPSKLCFPMALSDVDLEGSRVYKCFDYRLGGRVQLLPKRRRRHDYYSKFLSGTVVELENYFGNDDSESLVIISYPFIPGSHVPTYVSQLMSILEELLAMHREGYVHGDVRLRNMVFGSSVDNSSAEGCLTPHPQVNCYGRIIDFDLSGEEDKDLYPARYVKNLRDTVRHDDAGPSAPLKRIHDMHSFTQILGMFELHEHPNRDEYLEWKKTVGELQLLPYDPCDVDAFHKSVLERFDKFLSLKIILTDATLAKTLACNHFDPTGSPP